MRKLLLLGIVGFAAQLVDGSLGMAYGVTSSSLLLVVGLTPVITSAAVHLAELGTTLASGAAHCRFGNIEWPLVRRIALPGALGAFLGATVLNHLPASVAAPWMGALLFGLGCYLLVRFTWRPPRTAAVRPLRRSFLAPLGLFGGFVDATGGGGWGPVATPVLLANGGMQPRKVIGSVDTSEFVVSVGASLGFLIGLGNAAVPLDVVAALLVGGLVAAPIAAWLVRKLPGRVLGAGVGGLIMLANARTVLLALGTSDTARYAVYSCAIAAWTVGLLLAVRATARERRAVAAADAPA